MTTRFADQRTEDLYHGKSSKHARKVPKSIWRIVQRKLDLLNRAVSLRDFRVPPSNRLEKRISVRAVSDLTVVPQNVIRREITAGMIVKVTKRTEREPSRSLMTEEDARAKDGLCLSSA